MSAKILCFASAKGGSGKTTITANIAAFLSDVGKKCLIIDCDAATHGMTLLYLVEVSKKDYRQSYGLFDMANSVMEVSLEESLVVLENGVDFLPATYRFKANFDPEESFSDHVLRNVISSLKEGYDYILLDAQAGSDKYSRLAMNRELSDEVIIVSEYDPLSAAGIERLKQVAGDDLDYTRTWVLLNKMLPEFADRFSEFLSVTKYLPPIPWNADVVRAFAARRLALDVERGNAYTLAIMRTVKTLLGDSIRGEIEAWAADRAASIRAPIDDQLKDAEKELTFLLHRQEENSRATLRNFFVKVMVLLFSIAAAVIISAQVLIPSPLEIEHILGLPSEIFSSVFVLVASLGVLAVFTPFFIGALGSTKVDSIEGRRYKRQIEILEEKLTQLEALRSADLETIIKETS